MLKPTRIVVSRDSDFYWGRPVGYRKCGVLQFIGMCPTACMLLHVIICWTCCIGLVHFRRILLVSCALYFHIATINRTASCPTIQVGYSESCAIHTADATKLGGVDCALQWRLNIGDLWCKTCREIKLQARVSRTLHWNMLHVKLWMNYANTIRPCLGFFDRELCEMNQH